MDKDEIAKVKERERQDLDLLRRAERALAEIDRSVGLSDEQADVLAALRIRIEGKRRASLEELLQAAGDMESSRRDLKEVLSGEEKKARPDLGDILRRVPPET